MSEAGVFDQCFALVVGAEGGLSLVTSDPGNWTGGTVGSGTLQGSAFGISAAQWFGKTKTWPPTLAEAKEIYLANYWGPVMGDKLPPAVALVMFDIQVNGGHAIRWLQGALGVPVDGKMGPVTTGAAAVKSPGLVVAELYAQKLVYDSTLGNWVENRLGWCRRVTHMTLASTAVGPAQGVLPLAPPPAPVTVMASMDDIRSVVAALVGEKK